MTGTMAPFRPAPPEGSDGFAQLLRSEWTKFRTVRGWVIGMLAAALVIVALGLLPGMKGSCGQHGPGSACSVAVGPGGEPVSDSFRFVHQPLTGNGSITVRVTALAGLLPGSPAGRDALAGTRRGVAPWAKAGLIIKANLKSGSAYAAVLVTGSHGVRMQYNYTGDIAGRPGAVSAAPPRWLRLTRAGGTVTGYQSADGTHWSRLGAVHLAGLPAAVQVGLFTTSPQYTQAAGPSGASGGPTQATAQFDHLRLQGYGRPADGGWASTGMGGAVSASPEPDGGFRHDGGSFTVTGSGDIAPATSGAAGFGATIAETLIGTFAGLVAVVVVAAMFVTAEYRRGLIRVTLAASPRRGRVLAAKALVTAAAAFAAGLAAAAIVVTFGQRVLRGNGVFVYPASGLTELRVIAGTAAVLAVAAVLALAIGALLRRSAGAVAAVIVVIVLPYLLAVTALPVGPARWLLRVTPAAAFAVQQTMPQYPQVSGLYTPAEGFYPLAPWAGFAVLCGYAAAALALAVFLLNRRDA